MDVPDLALNASIPCWDHATFLPWHSSALLLRMAFFLTFNVWQACRAHSFLEHPVGLTLRRPVQTDRICKQNQYRQCGTNGVG